MFSWHDNLKQHTYVRWLANSSRRRRLLRQVKNGCSVRCTRWRERIINLIRETRDGWILQSKRFWARNHAALRFAHKLALVCRRCALKQNTERLLNFQVRCIMEKKNWGNLVVYLKTRTHVEQIQLVVGCGFNCKTFFFFPSNIHFLQHLRPVGGGQTSRLTNAERPQRRVAS